MHAPSYLSKQVTVWGAEALLSLLAPATVKALLELHRQNEGVIMAVRRLMHEIESVFDEE